MFSLMPNNTKTTGNRKHAIFRDDSIVISPAATCFAVMGWILILAAIIFMASPASASIKGRTSERVVYDNREEIRCLALNIYHEARGESDAGKLAVGHVVMNRVTDRSFPSAVCDVVGQGGFERRHKCQFSWWCDGRSDKPKNWESWYKSEDLARRIYSGLSKDPTRGALWYHAEYVEPHWRTAFRRGPKIGQHIFYFRSGRPGRGVQTAAWSTKIRSRDIDAGKVPQAENHSAAAKDGGTVLGWIMSIRTKPSRDIDLHAENQPAAAKDGSTVLGWIMSVRTKPLPQDRR